MGSRALGLAGPAFPMLIRFATAGLTAAACAGALAGVASGGSYHVYGCRTPAGEAAPADGWVQSKSGAGTVTEETCGEAHGALVAGLRDFTPRTANTAAATWAFTAPAATRIGGAVLWRAGDADGG